VVLVPIAATISQVAAGLDLDSDVIALRNRARHRHLQSALELREHATEEPPEPLLVVDARCRRKLWLPWNPPRHVVRHQRQDAGNVAGAEAGK